jgi:hypothetical protein
MVAAAAVAALTVAGLGFAPSRLQAEPAPGGAPAIRFTASLSPERLGEGTTISIAFAVEVPPHSAPSPLTQMSLLLPPGLEVGATDELGLQTCSQSRLQRTRSCPPDSLIGHGGASTAVSFGSQLVFEHVAVKLFSGPLANGSQTVLVNAHGEHPVLASLVFPGSILSTPRHRREQLQTSLPPVPVLPEAPDIAVVRFHTTIGPQGITYSERVKGRLIRFHPHGILLPSRCPRGGFRFALRLRFQDGAEAQARTAVACPKATSFQLSARRSKRLSAVAIAPSVNAPSRSSLDRADTHSTSVAHHTHITGSCDALASNPSVLDSVTISGTIAELSQNLNGPRASPRSARQRRLMQLSGLAGSCSATPSQAACEPPRLPQHAPAVRSFPQRQEKH